VAELSPQDVQKLRRFYDLRHAAASPLLAQGAEL
jgi:hypothetical protein